MVNVNQPTSKLVNQLGKYLYKNIDSSYKYEKEPNKYIVYMLFLYQLPLYKQNPYKGEEYNDVHEMKIAIDITTYNNLIRINFIEITPEERTIGYKTYDPSRYSDVKSLGSDIYSELVKKIKKFYSEYEILI